MDEGVSYFCKCFLSIFLFSAAILIPNGYLLIIAIIVFAFVLCDMFG